MCRPGDPDLFTRLQEAGIPGLRVDMQNMRLVIPGFEVLGLYCLIGMYAGY